MEQPVRYLLLVLNMNPVSVAGQDLFDLRPDLLLVPWVRLEVEHSRELSSSKDNQLVRTRFWPREVIVEGIEVAVPFASHEFNQPAIEGGDQVVEGLNFSAVDLVHAGAV